ncbi:hypothetical protein NG798_25430 [Ancylothrix sp. C2]|uniref:hypothetical protein n=1 Tax=Ancylothrix sp. D3o TaxID=2953691 RepID=UPI0021BAA70D|nr:hypothetical protein [Ancylothrix sp. D3o]MCT7953145.1 hypothetical protein [Ancylothrix sp. D3o]
MYSWMEVGQRDISRPVDLLGADGCSGAGGFLVAGEGSDVGRMLWACEAKEVGGHHIWPVNVDEPVSR